MNKAILIGNVTRDPEIKKINDSTVVDFGLATNKKYKNREGNQVESVEFHNVTAWGKLAEIIATYVKKGHKLYIEGEIRTRTYEKDGVKHYATQIVAHGMEMLTPKGVKKPDGTRADGLPDPSDYSNSQEIRVEDIPFG